MVVKGGTACLSLYILIKWVRVFLFFGFFFPVRKGGYEKWIGCSLEVTGYRSVRLNPDGWFLASYTGGIPSLEPGWRLQSSHKALLGSEVGGGLSKTALVSAQHFTPSKPMGHRGVGVWASWERWWHCLLPPLPESRATCVTQGSQHQEWAAWTALWLFCG